MNKEKKQFQRTKPNLNICTAGHVDDGKTTLTAAMTYVQSLDKKGTFSSYEAIDKAPEEKQRGITINVSVVNYYTEKFHVIQSDTPGHSDYVKNATVGFNQTDYALLVVDINGDDKVQTRQHLNLMKNSDPRVKKLFIVFTKRDLFQGTDEELAQIEELQYANMIMVAEKYGFKAEDIICTTVSAFEALNNVPRGIESIKKLIKLIDVNCESNESEIEKKSNEPFLMSIDNPYNITGVGKVVTGRILYGKVKTGDKLQLVGFRDEPIDVKVGDVEMFKQTLKDGGKPNDNSGILIKSSTYKFDDKFPAKGQCLIQPNSYKIYTEFKTRIFVASESEGGKKKGFQKSFRFQIFSRTAHVSAGIKEMFDEDAKNKIDFVQPGSVVVLHIILDKPLLITHNQHITIREGGNTVGAGRVIELIK